MLCTSTVNTITGIYSNNAVVSTVNLLAEVQSDSSSIYYEALSDLTYTGASASTGYGGAILSYGGTIGMLGNSASEVDEDQIGCLIGTNASLYSTSFSGNYVAEDIGYNNGNYYLVYTNGIGICNGGGAIALTMGKINYISEVIFSENKAAYGGAILNATSSTIGEIYNSTFYANEAYHSGGAIANSANYYAAYSKSYYSVINSISYSSFIENTAVYYGGAIYNNESYIDEICNSIFSGNKAAYGGAIYNVYGGGIGEIDNVIFYGNSASVSGGAIFTQGALSANEDEYTGLISNSYFDSNTAEVSGGAIHQDWEYLSIQDTSFVNNSAGEGGAIYLYGVYYDGSTAYDGSTMTYTLTADTGYLSMSGNTAGKGGFLFLGGDYGYDGVGALATFDIQGASSLLVIGAYDESFGTDSSTFGTADSIYAESGSVFTKTGAGTLLLHSIYDNYGALAVNEGIMILDGDTAAGQDDSGNDIY